MWIILIAVHVLRKTNENSFSAAVVNEIFVDYINVWCEAEKRDLFVIGMNNGNIISILLKSTLVGNWILK